MPKMVCVACKRELRVKRNGVPAVEMAQFGPYKMWATDSWQCPGCGQVILAGFSQNTTAEHFQKDFKEKQEKAKGHPDYIEFT